ncbi:hypothetical protein X975_13104, partial [Stegodyphus mimosarum]
MLTVSPKFNPMEGLAVCNIFLFLSCGYQCRSPLWGMLANIFRDQSAK